MTDEDHNSSDLNILQADSLTMGPRINFCPVVIEEIEDTKNLAE